MALGRRTYALLAGAALCATVSACTAEGPAQTLPSPSPSASSDSATPTAPATITLGVYGPKESLEAYDELAASFTAEHPNITVKVERHRDAEDVKTAVQSGKAPDLFLMDHSNLPKLVEEGLVQPVDGLLEARQVDFGDGYQRSGLTAFAADAALQCMPHDVSPLVVYYNEDLVNLELLATDQEEPPSALDGWTWEMFTAAARQASRGRSSGVYIEPSLTSLAPFVWSAGGDIVDDPQQPTTLTLSDGEARTALEQVLALVRDPQVTPTGAELDKQDAVTRFTQGKLGMIVGTRELTPVFRDTENLRFDVMPLPSLGRFRTVADMTGYCLSSGTAEVEAAADLLAYAVSREGAAITARPGYLVPSNLEVANSPLFLQQSREPSSSFIFNEGVRRAQSLPFTPAWPDLTVAVAPSLDRMFYAPVIDLDALLEDIDTLSEGVLAPEEQ